MATNIGSQDGITAMHNVYRDEWPDKTLLKKGSDGKWPDMWLELADVPRDQWKSIDKHQRAEQILVDDHDANFSDGGTKPPPSPIEITRDLTLVQNALILADDPWPALNSPLHYNIWVTADQGYRHLYEDGSFIEAAYEQDRKVFSWCDCKAVLGNGTAPEVAIQMAIDFDLDGACGEGEHSLAFEAGYNAGMRIFVVNMSALTQAQIDLINEDGETAVSAELYLNKDPTLVVDWKNCVGVGSNCGATYASDEPSVATPIDVYAVYPNAVYQTMCWYCGGNPKPDFARLP